MVGHKNETGMPITIVPPMSSHMAPHIITFIGLISLLVYQPSPRPPYLDPSYTNP
jgi:hypothetical protein